MNKVQPAAFRNSQYNIFVQAVDASTKLDYTGVVSACDNILNVSNDGMTRISSNLQKVQLGKEVLCVEDSSLEPVLDEVTNLFKSLPEQGISPALEEIKELALQVFNDLQDAENAAAKADFDAKVSSAQASASN